MNRWFVRFCDYYQDVRIRLGYRSLSQYPKRKPGILKLRRSVGASILWCKRHLYAHWLTGNSLAQLLFARVWHHDSGGRLSGVSSKKKRWKWTIDIDGLLSIWIFEVRRTMFSRRKSGRRETVKYSSGIVNTRNGSLERHLGERRLERHYNVEIMDRWALQTLHTIYTRTSTTSHSCYDAGVSTTSRLCLARETRTLYSLTSHTRQANRMVNNRYQQIDEICDKNYVCDVWYRPTLAT